MPGHYGAHSGPQAAGGLVSALGKLIFKKRINENEIEKDPARMEFMQYHFRAASDMDKREGTDKHVRAFAERAEVREEWLRDNVGTLAPSNEMLREEKERDLGVPELEAVNKWKELARIGEYSDEAARLDIAGLTAQSEGADLEENIARKLDSLSYFETRIENGTPITEAKREDMVSKLGLRTASAVLDLYDGMPNGEEKNALAYSIETPSFLNWLNARDSRDFQRELHELSMLPKPGEEAAYKLKTSIVFREILNDASDRLFKFAEENGKDSPEYKEAEKDFNWTNNMLGQFVAGNAAFPRDYGQAGFRARPLAKDLLEVNYRNYESTGARLFMEDLVQTDLFSTQYDNVDTLEDLLEQSPEASAAFSSLARFTNGVFMQEELRKNFPEFVETGRGLAIENNPAVVRVLDAEQAFTVFQAHEPVQNPAFLYEEFVSGLSEPFKAFLNLSGVEQEVLKQLEAGGATPDIMEIVRQIMQVPQDVTKFQSMQRPR